MLCTHSVCDTANSWLSSHELARRQVSHKQSKGRVAHLRAIRRATELTLPWTLVEPYHCPLEGRRAGQRQLPRHCSALIASKGAGLHGWRRLAELASGPAASASRPRGGLDQKLAPGDYRDGRVGGGCCAGSCSSQMSGRWRHLRVCGLCAQSVAALIQLQAMKCLRCRLMLLILRRWQASLEHQCRSWLQSKDKRWAAGLT